MMRMVLGLVSAIAEARLLHALHAAGLHRPASYCFGFLLFSTGRETARAFFLLPFHLRPPSFTRRKRDVHERHDAAPKHGRHVLHDLGSGPRARGPDRR